MSTSAEELKYKIKKRLVHFIFEHWKPKLHTPKKGDMLPPNLPSPRLLKKKSKLMLEDQARLGCKSVAYKFGYKPFRPNLGYRLIPYQPGYKAPPSYQKVQTTTTSIIPSNSSAYVKKKFKSDTKPINSISEPIPSTSFS